jgi:uracil-DNA glycosylase
MNYADDDENGLARLLAWHQAMGADAVLDGMPTDWLSRGPAAPGADYQVPQLSAAKAQSAPHQGDRPVSSPALGTPPPLPRAANTAPAIQPPRPAAAASKAAVRGAPVEAANLEELETKLRAFDGCGLKATATKLCFYRGAPRARLMIIGEAPGRDEDLEGRPFVGRAGQLLDKMLSAIGATEAEVHITNIVYWRPPGNRTPTPQEALACRPFLDRQIELVAPDVVLLAGGSAAKHILETEDGIMRVRGKWFEPRLGQRTIKTMATLHPAYLLRTPASKRQVWRDLLAVKEFLKDGRSF